jgi:shikimate kinase
MNIYLAGMIGAGKTTVGREISGRLGWPLEDFDATMAAMAGKDFRQVVAEEGWLGFRQREYLICKKFAAGDRAVAALGGGTVRYQWNLDVMKGTGVNILFVAELDVLAERVRSHDRPRVNPNTSLEEDLAQIWSTSKDLYYAWSDFVYRTDQGKTPAEEAQEVIDILRRDYGLQP